MFRPEARARTTLRWGGAIGLLLALQSLLLAGLFWLLASGAQVRDAERRFSADCLRLGALPAPARTREVREMLDEDVHRDRFLALFAADGRLITGNVARLPNGVQANGRSVIAPVTPTELPGKASDVARLTLCPMPDDVRLLTGVDLDDAEQALVAVERALLIGLAPGLLMALAFGLFAGRQAARQIDTVRQVTARIVRGDFDGRLPVPAHPDSFGLLCLHINTMLDRLELLVGEVRGVGDDIAHQIRTPLTRLRARLERLPDPADAGMALAEVDKVLGIVAALLRIRELEDHARRSRFAPVRLDQLVHDACDLHAPDVEERGMTLCCIVDGDATIEGDASLLMEAISNLIDNAIKFGPAGGVITVTLARGDAGPVLSVADQGAGVPAAERELVTQRFYRGRRDVDGAGLGLSLVKAIADLHGLALGFAPARSAVTLSA